MHGIPVIDFFCSSTDFILPGQSRPPFVVSHTALTSTDVDAYVADVRIIENSNTMTLCISESFLTIRKYSNHTQRTKFYEKIFHVRMDLTNLALK